MKTISHNGKWEVITSPIPLRSSVRVQKYRMLIVGFCWFRHGDDGIELMGGVWSSPPDLTEYEQNTLIGHTGVIWEGDEHHVEEQRRKNSKRYTDE